MESIVVQADTKSRQYAELLPQLKALWAGEPDLIANMANTCAALMQVFKFHWVGFYLVKNQELVLGPFQGPVACTRIGFGKGVCGTAWENEKTLLVPNVETFPGHIACSALSQSEIVVPVFGIQNAHPESLSAAGQVIAVLDVDSEFLNHFDETDQFWLEKICAELMA
jgi:L-methionine (R)-S-oxide reductase